MVKPTDAELENEGTGLEDCKLEGGGHLGTEVATPLILCEQRKLDKEEEERRCEVSGELVS
jgi:hypothetical protein